MKNLRIPEQYNLSKKAHKNEQLRVERAPIYKYPYISKDHDRKMAALVHCVIELQLIKIDRYRRHDEVLMSVSSSLEIRLQVKKTIKGHVEPGRPVITSHIPLLYKTLLTFPRDFSNDMKYAAKEVAML